MHAHTRDEKVRKSEQYKDGQWAICTHELKMTRREKVSKTNMGNRGNARTNWRRQDKKK
jgi:hypothetical protein